MGKGDRMILHYIPLSYRSPFLQLHHRMCLVSLVLSFSMIIGQHGSVPSLIPSAAAALPIWLRHASTTQCQAVLCRLLCCSKAMRAAVMLYCSGRVAMSAKPFDYVEPNVRNNPHSRAFKQRRLYLWIAKHGTLLDHLDVQMKMDHCSHNLDLGMLGPGEPYHGSPPLAAALQQAAAAVPAVLGAAPPTAAAAATGSLQLQSARLGLDCSTGAAVLQQLPVAHLTRLDVRFVGTDNCRDSINARASRSAPAFRPAALTHTVAALAGLTRLRSLALSVVDNVFDEETYAWDWEQKTVDQLLPALSGLCSLTQLSLLTVLNKQCLQQLPAQLRELELRFAPEQLELPSSGQEDDGNFNAGSSGGDGAGSPSAGEEGEECGLDLGHLTALTRLRIGAAAVWDCQYLDVLPRSLRVLQLQACASVAPLVPLQQLQELHVGEWSAPQQDLEQLSSLVQLTCVRFKPLGMGFDWEWSRGGMAAATGAAAPAAAVAAPAVALAGPAWTSLSLVFASAVRDVAHMVPAVYDANPVAGFIPALQQPASLGDLMHGYTYLTSMCRYSPTAQQLAAALQQLTGLQRLELHAQGAAAASATASAASSGVGMDVVMQAIAALPKLRSLSLNTPLDGAGFRQLAAATQLTCLSLQAPLCVSDGCLIQLVSQLPGLRELYLSNVGVGEAGLMALACMTQLQLKRVHAYLSPGGAATRGPAAAGQQWVAGDPLQLFELLL